MKRPSTAASNAGTCREGITLHGVSRRMLSDLSRSILSVLKPAEPRFQVVSFLGGCNPLASQFCTCGNRNGSRRSQLMHWNLRPPVLAGMKCIALRHCGQGGGGGFLGTVLTITWECIRTLCHRDKPETATNVILRA